MVLFKTRAKKYLASARCLAEPDSINRAHLASITSSSGKAVAPVRRGARSR
ncbi:hypothetical protein ZHAS_00005127 [Anopheles sinensis]|uniref:Uncharacterized protein n=1 Tax=Anopheles sinensis TaxID=74873 RepID=A0A084VIQ8_ANOSI|nr:hypothetical protein ZHAS_00005127 [Anopheles sinensis]